jgi:sugar phosphate isomerase/epimerase
MVDNGIKQLELGADHGFFEDTNQIIKIKKENELDVTVHAFFPPAKKNFMLNIGSANPEILKETINVAKNCIEFCNKIEARLYSLHSPYLSEVDTKGAILTKAITLEKCSEITKETLREIADYAKMYNIRIAVENHSGLNLVFVFTKPSMVKQLIKEAGVKNVGLLVDVGHLNVAATKFGFDKKKEINDVRDMIMELHISENDGTADQHRPLTSTKMLDCFQKDILQKVILTLEGINWTFEDIGKSKKIIESLVK